MRICVIRNAEAEITTSFYRIVDAIIDSGNTPVILSRNRECSEISINKKEYIFKDKPIDNYEINIPAKRGAGLKNIFQLVIYQYILLKWLKQNRDKYDMVHSFDFDAGLPCSIINKKLKFRHIYHIADFYTESRNMPGVLKKFFRKQEIKVIDKSDFTIICNEERFEQIKGCNQPNIEVVHNVPVINEGLLDYIKNYNNNVNSSKLRLCYVGKLSKNRFIEDVIKVISENKNLHLDIAGIGPFEDEVKNSAEKFENINYYGKLNYEDAIKLYLDCDIMFAIYDPKVPNHRYSAPNKIYEAMILNKPIIVAKGTGMDKIVNENNMGYVIDYDKEDFKRIISEIISDRTTVKSMGINAGNAYDKYCWDTMKSRIINIYNNLK
ncbi:glycosyltransferase [Peptacetobacter hominis]|uniref:Glycosyltransferase n=1 Tax=Peptacetobacter hominis TaxID=2743610 RepID=A0A544QTC8_9FIRM|nr:glycosyltransferase [Peptacetobacter hominis]TQQ83945.1 glycosyltransferase [Peptacetobacter hominis]